MHIGKTWSCEDILVTNHFAFMIAEEIMTDTPDPLIVREAQNRSDWPKWDEAINFELDSLIRRQVFGLIVPV
jgi:hypothetical protein